MSIYIFAIILFHLLYERGSYTTGVILQTFRLADRPPGRSAMFVYLYFCNYFVPSPIRKRVIYDRCYIADLPPCRSPPGRSATLQTFPPPGRSATLQTFPRKICNIAKFATLQIFPLSLQVFPGEDLQHCRPSPIFVKFRILIFGYIEKRGFKL